MASLNRSQDYFVIMEFESSLNLTEHYSKNLLHQNSGHPLNFKPTLFTRSLVLTALGIISVKRLSRCLLTRKKEHIRNVKSCSKGSNIANHVWTNNHLIDFENANVIDKGDYRVRKTLESWHTAMTTEADKNSKPLPRQYSILLRQ